MAVRQAVGFGLDPYAYLDRCKRAHGDTFTLRFPHLPPSIVTGDPRFVKEIFALSAADIRSDLHPLPVSFGRHSILLSDGDLHAEHRKLLMPDFHDVDQASQSTVIHEVVSSTMESWRIGDQLELYTVFRDMSLTVLLRSIFATVDGARERWLRELYVRWSHGALSPLTSTMSLFLSGRRIRAWLDAAEANEMQRRRAYTGEPGVRASLRHLAKGKADLVCHIAAEIEAARQAGPRADRGVINRLAHVEDSTGQPLDEREIVDQIITLLVAGHETTAHALCWATHHIFSRPTVLARLSEACGERPIEDIMASNCPRNPSYLEACVLESMRLSPVFAFVARTLRVPRMIAGHQLPANSTLWPSAYLLQRRADIWERPDEFLPERHQATGCPRQYLLPWGGGVRRCLGAGFALQQICIVLARLVATVNLELPRRVRPMVRGLSIAPRGGLRVKIRNLRSGRGRPRNGRYEPCHEQSPDRQP